jgi:hypothetical protein
MAIRRIGFEGDLFGGTAGSTATTAIDIVRDVNYKIESTEGDVSDRSDITDYARTTGVKVSLEFELNNEEGNAVISALRTAATTGATYALKTADKTSGWGIDADFNISLDESQPLRDAQRIKVTASPNNDARTVTWG